MKKFILALLTGSVLFLTGCLDTTEEITLNEDGTGSMTNTSDLGAVLTLLKQMGGKDAEKMGDLKVDTTIMMASQVDSIASLTAEEKALMKAGSMSMKVDMKSEKAVFVLKFPFSNFADIARYNKLASKLMNETMKDKLASGAGAPKMEEMPPASSFDDYYDINYSNGLIVKSLNKTKYAGAEKDQFLVGMKEAGGMGIPIVSTKIINLPRPAKKVEGKNVVLSDDKRKLTVKTSIDDFFDEPSKLEFRVEY